MLSIVIPSYNEEKMIQLTAETISNILIENNIGFELIFVDDGSKDNTWELISIEAEKQYGDSRVRGLKFSRNFGKEAAIMAGLSAATGDCAAVIDCDLQHPPAKLVEMYRLWEEGYEIVEGVKSSRGNEKGIHEFAANSFYAILNSASGLNLKDASDFKLMDRKAVDVLVSMKEKDGFFRASSAWVGFKKTRVYFDVQDRVAGESKWSTKSLTKYAVNNITAFSAAPMLFVAGFGIFAIILAVVACIFAIVQAATGGSGAWPLFTITAVLLVGGIIMISMGIIGYYISKVYNEVKDRPLYIVSEER